MATCKWCGRSGFLLALTPTGLCNKCDPAIAIEVNSRLRVITESQELVESGKALDTRLSRCDLIVEFANALRKYEEKGIRITDPLPSVIAERYRAKRSQILIEGLKLEARKTLDKVKLTGTVTTKVNQLSKLLLLVRDHKSESPSKELDELESDIALATSNVKLEGYLGDAHKAEFMGNKKKAVEKYYEALYLLKNDSVLGELAAPQLSEIESKLVELTGSPHPGVDRSPKDQVPPAH